MVRRVYQEAQRHFLRSFKACPRGMQPNQRVVHQSIRNTKVNTWLFRESAGHSGLFHGASFSCLF